MEKTRKDTTKEIDFQNLSSEELDMIISAGEKNKNQDRFDRLRGYFDKKGFHSRGQPVGVSKDNLLRQLGFESFADFLVWYKSLTPEEIKEGKKDWCSVDCSCQSILSELLRMEKIKELTLKMLKEENKNKISPDTDLVINEPIPITFWEKLRDKLKRYLP